MLLVSRLGTFELPSDVEVKGLADLADGYIISTVLSQM
jgi:hypothetical protein